MKKLIFLLLLFVSVKGFSQGEFYRLGFGITTGLTASYTGFSYGVSKEPDTFGFVAEKGLTTNVSYVAGASVDYYFTPYLYAGVEYNKVQLRDGTDIFNRAFVADFSSIEIRGTISAGQIIDFSGSPFLTFVKNANFGIGLGFINGINNVKPFSSSEFPRRRFLADIGKSKYSGVISFPVTVGYDINLYNVFNEVKFVIGLQARSIITTSDDIDGYNPDPAKFSNALPDYYATFNVSLKYLFGPRNVYLK